MKLPTDSAALLSRCPTCSAAQGVPCYAMGRAGLPLEGVHRSRAMLADENRKVNLLSLRPNMRWLAPGEMLLFADRFGNVYRGLCLEVVPDFPNMRGKPDISGTISVLVGVMLGEIATVGTPHALGSIVSEVIGRGLTVVRFGPGHKSPGPGAAIAVRDFMRVVRAYKQYRPAFIEAPATFNKLAWIAGCQCHTTISPAMKGQP